MVGAKTLRPIIVVATGNRGKVEEFRQLLDGLPVEIRAIGDVVPELMPVIEDGTTFAANALKKAYAAAAATGMIALADDSGLEVDALGGHPGVRSARFAGEHATDAENNAALLAALAASRTPAPFVARFRCVLAVLEAPVATEPFTVEGVCEGTIATSPRGSGGFGYDPLFVATGMTRTMAELTSDEKNRLSHRARAVAALRPRLIELLATCRIDRSARRNREP